MSMTILSSLDLRCATSPLKDPDAISSGKVQAELQSHLVDYSTYMRVPSDLYHGDQQLQIWSRYLLLEL